MSQAACRPIMLVIIKLLCNCCVRGCLCDCLSIWSVVNSQLPFLCSVTAVLEAGCHPCVRMPPISVLFLGWEKKNKNLTDLMFFPLSLSGDITCSVNYFLNWLWHNATHLKGLADPWKQAVFCFKLLLTHLAGFPLLPPRSHSPYPPPAPQFSLDEREAAQSHLEL